MAPALIALVILLASSVAQTKFTKCGKKGFPPELIGVWEGQNAYVVGKKPDPKECEPSFGAFLEGEGCHFMFIESCSKKTYSVGDSKTLEATKFNCSGPAAGFLHSFEKSTEKYSCHLFRRTGDELALLHGNPVDDEKDVVCPDPRGVFGETKSIAGRFVGELSDEDDSQPKKKFLCKK